MILIIPLAIAAIIVRFVICLLADSPYNPDNQRRLSGCRECAKRDWWWSGWRCPRHH
jgi:hypothetical protein